MAHRVLEARRPQELPVFQLQHWDRIFRAGFERNTRAPCPKVTQSSTASWGGGGPWAGAGSAPRSRSEGGGALGPTPHPLPGQGCVPGRIPPTGAPPALGQAAVLGAQPVFTSPEAMCWARLTRKGLGKMVLQGGLQGRGCRRRGNMGPRLFLGLARAPSLCPPSPVLPGHEGCGFSPHHFPPVCS